jgi:hypothetical protein
VQKQNIINNKNLKCECIMQISLSEENPFDGMTF